MDIIDRHFAAENAHDVEGTLATYTDDITWDDVTHPLSPVQGKQAVASVYRGILDAIPDLHLRTVRRLNFQTHVIDESILTGHVDGEFAGVEGAGAPVEFRMLHVFDIRDGLISRENTWFDASIVRRQIEAYKASKSMEGRDTRADLGIR
jgi:steroid delta-isomerase-like uncharacterized protein